MTNVDRKTLPASFLLVLTMMYKRRFTKEQALQKLKHYCAYQERCMQDVKDKLFELRISKKYHDEMINHMVENNILNEERFAIAFATGKFRINQWGKIKIRYELKQRKINEDYIRKALQQIDQSNYEDVLNVMAKEKYDSLKTEQYLIRKKKALDYLLQKGFESGLINKVLSQLTAKIKEQ